MINHLASEQNWQAQLSDLIVDPAELLQLLDLPVTLLPPALAAAESFGLRVPRVFVSRMQKANPLDPLLLQVLPLHQELTVDSRFSLDPLAERHSNPVTGLLHKYQRRLLLTLTGACAIHCRYCFRRHFPYQDNLPGTQEWPAIRDYIQADPELNEVILSGGDPLSVSNRRFFEWLERLESMPQLTTLRIHTRLPVVLPARMDTALLERLRETRLKIVLVIHCNHAQELDNTVLRVLQACKDHGMVLLNQSVLLKGINSSADELILLSERLFDAGVLPYYLHLLDKVQGAAHFDLSRREALAIYREMMERLPGYLLPRLVRETPEAPFKVPLLPDFGRANSE